MSSTVFRFFQRRFGERETHPENPGEGVSGTVTFANDSGTWAEEFDLVALLEGVLARRHGAVRRRKQSVLLSGTDYVFQPRLVSLLPLEDGGVQLATTIEVSHREQCPEGVFEYQHSGGETIREAVESGFEHWADGDLPVFLDLLEEKPRKSQALEMTFPGTDGRDLRRQVILGPVIYVGQNYDGEESGSEGGEAHAPLD